MSKLNVMEARKTFSKTVNRVAFGKERIVLERHGQEVAALIPVEDVRLLEELEDRLDAEAARESLKEPGSNISWEEARTRLGR